MKLAVIGGSREAELLIDAVKKLDIEINPNAGHVVIAPHPFDSDLIECALLSLGKKPHIILQRPKWKPEIGDKWHMASSAKHAAEILVKIGAKRALLAVGNGRLAPFYRLSDITLFVRSRNKPHPPKPPKGEICPTRGPFDVSFEIDGMIKAKIDALVVHNAGGLGGWPKMEAARALSIPVVLIDRPEPPDAKIVETVADAVNWVAASLGLDLTDLSA